MASLNLVSQSSQSSLSESIYLPPLNSVTGSVVHQLHRDGHREQSIKESPLQFSELIVEYIYIYR